MATVVGEALIPNRCLVAALSVAFVIADLSLAAAAIADLLFVLAAGLLSGMTSAPPPARTTSGIGKGTAAGVVHVEKFGSASSSSTRTTDLKFFLCWICTVLVSNHRTHTHP